VIKDIISRFILRGENQLGATFGQASKQVDALHRGAARLKGLLVGVGLATIFRGVIANTAEADAAVAQLNATLKSSDRYSDANSQALQDYASQLQRVTTFSDEAIIVAESQLLIFDKLGSKVFPRATEAALDMATKMGGDVKGAVLKVGKALQDPVKGLTALSKAGVQFSESEKEVIKKLVETNRLAEAQDMVLQKLEQRFGGSARAARDTLGGALESLKNTVGELLEGDAAGGGVSGATQGINDLGDTLNDPKIKEGFQNLIQGAAVATGWFAKLAAGVANLSVSLAEDLAVALNGGKPAMDDFVRRAKDIAELERRLAAFTEEQGRTVADSFSGRGLQDMIDALREKISLQRESLTIDAQDAALAGQNRNSGGASTIPGLDGDPLAPIVVTAERREKELAAIMAKINKHFRDVDQHAAENIQKMLDDISREVQEFSLNDDDKALLRLTDAGADEATLNRARQLFNELQALRDTQTEIKDATDERNALEEEYAGLVASTRTDIEDHAALVQRVVDLYAQGIIPNFQEYEQALIRINGKFVESQEKVSELDEFSKQAARNIESYFADYLFDPFDASLKGMLRSFVDMVRRMAAEALAAQIANKLFGGSGSSGGGGGWLGTAIGAAAAYYGGSSGSSTGGTGGGSYAGFAKGGDFPTGKPIIVGERGPEIIVPRGAGSVIPNHKLGGNTITVNIDARESDNPGRLLALVPVIQSQIEQSLTLKSRRGYL